MRLVLDPGVQEPPKYSQSFRNESTCPAQARAEEPAPAGLRRQAEDGKLPPQPSTIATSARAKPPRMSPQAVDATPSRRNAAGS